MRCRYKIVRAGSGRNHTVVVTEDGQSLAFGWNKHGQLGSGSVRNGRFIILWKFLRSCDGTLIVIALFLRICLALSIVTNVTCVLSGSLLIRYE